MDVCVSGIGLVSPAGIGVLAAAERVRDGRTCLGPPTYVADETVVSCAGELPFDLSIRLSSENRYLAMVRSACDQALAQSGANPARLLFVLGTGLGPRPAVDWPAGTESSAPHATHAFAGLAERCVDALGLVSGVVINTACSSSSDAVIHAVRLMQMSVIDGALVVGCDEFNMGLYYAFRGINAIHPARCEPFADSRGTTFGEAAAAMVLEPRRNVLARGSGVLAEVWGVGSCSESFSWVRPHPDGRGTRLSVSRALLAAGVTEPRGAVGLLVAHGTGTKAGDAAELTAARDMELPTERVLSTKGILGHSHGASGLVDLVLSVAWIRDSSLGPRVGLSPRQVEPVVKVSSALGGLHSAVVLRGADSAAVDSTPHDEVSAVVAAQVSRTVRAELTGGGGVSEYVRFCADVVREVALLLAGALDDGDRDGVAVSLVTASGPSIAWQVLASERRAGRPVNPAMAPYLSFYSPAVAVSMALGSSGPIACFLGGGRAAAHAIVHSTALVRMQASPVALVVAVDEVLPDDTGLPPTIHVAACLIRPAAGLDPRCLPLSTPALQRLIADVEGASATSALCDWLSTAVETVNMA